MSSSSPARTLIGLLCALGLLLAACGNDDGAVSPPPAEEPETATDHDHSHDHDHDHDHATLMEVDYEPVPTIEIATHLDPMSGVNLEVTTTGFTLAPERASTDPVDGEGHMHIYLDGVKLRRLYGHWAHLDITEPGDHEIRVELSANNHAVLAVNGDKLDATAVVTIPGDAEPVAAAQEGGGAIELELADGKPVEGVKRYRVGAGDTVSIVVAGDTADELHIHGYDLVVEFSPGQPGTITFEADIPGIFEVESHHRGDLVMELQVG
ncbi:MAG: hypothetical protein OXF00_12535 [bacterium]|nr:hypothetical protein [bacterium]